MRRAGILALACSMLAGCAGTEPVRATTSLAKRLYTPFQTNDMIYLVVALLERPVGDTFINKELWDYTDEQVVDLERKAALDDNGFRVGQIVGLPPARLQELLASKRSCSNPRLQMLPVGRLAPQVLGPVLEHADFEVKQDGRQIAVSLDQVQFVLEVVPELAGDGRTRLRFTPKAQHGELLPEMRPAPDGSDWTLQYQKPCQTFAAASWDVTLAGNDFLVVGANFEQRESLGYQAFVEDDGATPVQRLLVIRACRPRANAGTLGELAGSSPPLAQQATAAFRANGQE
jgi:hypothetical protein